MILHQNMEMLESTANLQFIVIALIIQYIANCLQSTPDNSNLQGKSKKGSSYRELEENSLE